MLYPAFAYSTWMHLVLFFVSCATNFILNWSATNIILTIYGEKVTLKQRVMFIFWVGTVLNQFWIFGIYIASGFINFSQMIYNIVTFPNPVFAILYCYIAAKTLKLSIFHSIRLMRHMYLYWVIVAELLQIILRTFFVQSEALYNYILDIQALFVWVVLTSVIYVAIIKMFKRTKFLIRLTDRVQIRSIWFELSISFLQACVIYTLIVVMPIIMDTTVLSYLITLVIVSLVLMFSVMLDYKCATTSELENKDAYIGTLIKSIDQFSGVKHDFYNMLQVYSGYIEINDMDRLKKYHEKLLGTTMFAGEEIALAKHMNKNPALVALLIKKMELAQSQDVRLRMNILCSLGDLNISEFDICRVVGNLLDNAIDASAISQQKHIAFSIERKPNGSKLIIISNSTRDDVNLNIITLSGFTNKEGRSGLGLSQVRNTLGKYSNCTLQFTYYNHEFSVYIEVMPNTRI